MVKVVMDAGKRYRIGHFGSLSRGYYLLNVLPLLLFIIGYWSIIGWAWKGDIASKNRQAIRLYKDGKIDEAMVKWRDAQIQNPDNEVLFYNIGNGLYEQKKYDDAMKEYEKALNSQNAGFQSKTYYNMGNASYRQGKLLEAIEYYKKCLDINPDDEDAKYNIEFIRKKIKENLKKEQERAEFQKEETQRSEGGKEKEEGVGEAQPQEEKERESQEDREKEAEEKKEEKGERGLQEDEGKGVQKDRGEASQEEEKGKMSREDALRLLDALKDDEKDIQEQLRTHPVEGGYHIEKDW